MAEDRSGAEQWSAMAESALTRARTWIETARQRESGGRRPDDLLSSARLDADGVDFARRLLDRVVGSEDAFVSALGLREASLELPESLPAKDRMAVRAGSLASLGLPWAVLPLARRWLRERVAHLVLAAKLPEDAERLGRLAGLHEALQRHRSTGLVVEPALLGDVVHGPGRADLESKRLAALAAVPGIAHLAVDPERLAPGGSEWSAEDDLAAAAGRLRPVFEAALRHGTAITLEPRTVTWARRIPDLLVRALADPAFDSVRVGAGVFAELPESRDILERIGRWARDRVSDGGAPVEVVLGIAGSAPSERTASILSGLPVPVIQDRTQAAGQLLRLADLALDRAQAVALRPVFASEDPHLIAAFAEIAEGHGTAELFSVRFRSGILAPLAEVLAEHLPEVRVRLPLTSPREFGGASDALVALAAEAADPESVPARLGELQSVDLEAEARILRDELAEAGQPFPSSHRTQLRAKEWEPSERDSALFYRRPDEPTRFDTGGLTAAVLGLTRGETGELRLEAVAPQLTIPVVSASGFANEPGTDASLAPNREWARALLRRGAERAETEDLADATVAISEGERDPETAVARSLLAGRSWAAQSHARRATWLRRAALGTVAARDRLIEIFASCTGQPIGEIDAQVGDIVDAARYYAQLAEGLAAVRGAAFRPHELALVAADPRTPLAAQAEAVLAALAAGSGVLWAIPSQHASAARALVEEWEEGSLPDGTVQLVPVAGFEDSPAFVRLVADPAIQRATVLGDRALARSLAQRRPDLRIDGRFHGTGSILVTPSADPEAAVSDIVASGFAGAGASMGAAHAVVLLGSTSRSQRFRERLADAVRAIRVGDTARPGHEDPLGFSLGPLQEAPDAAGLRALTELARGEEWLVAPRRLDETGRLWSPGVRLGVSATASFWDDARGLPVIGVAHAHSLTEAIQLQERLGGGTVAGLQSYDEDEILPWLDRADAASLAVNRPTTGGRVERFPGGAWNGSVMGISVLAGGSNRLIPLGSWDVQEGTRSSTLHLRGLDPEVQRLIETAQTALDYEEFDSVRRGALADALAWRTSLGVMRDTPGLGIERNVLRHRPVETQLRLAEGGSVAELLRVLAAALLLRAPVSVSTGEVLPVAATAFLGQQGIEVSLERDEDWLERIAVAGPRVDGVTALRVRLIGGDRVRTAEWLGGLDRVVLWAEPVTLAGPVELLSLLREQSISVRTHRNGVVAPVTGLDEWLG